MSDFLFSAMYLLMGTMWSEVLKINCNKTDFSMGIAPNSLSEKFHVFGDMKKYFLGKTLKKNWVHNGMYLLMNIYHGDSTRSTFPEL